MAETTTQATPATSKREPRDLNTREASQRPAQWTPPQLLPEPEPEDGYAFRWIRVGSMGSPDAVNISARFREGWEPVKADSQPKMFYLRNPQGRFPDGIEIGGLLLCKTPAEFVEQRSAYYNGQAAAQMTSVDNSFMRESDPRMPLFNERQTKVSRFGKDDD